MMFISLFLDMPVSAERILRLYSFLLDSGIAPDGALLMPQGPFGDVELPAHDAFVHYFDEMAPDLEIAFLNDQSDHNAALMKNHHLPKLLLGTRDLPRPLSQVSVPFESTRFAAKWLEPVLAEAALCGWHVRLLHCDQSLVSKEAVKLAEWFHLDYVKSTLVKWLTEDAKSDLHALIERFPDVEVHGSVGGFDSLLDAEGPDLFLLGGLSSGYHMPNKHHGLNYGKWLTHTGASGYFIAE